MWEGPLCPTLLFLVLIQQGPWICDQISSGVYLHSASPAQSPSHITQPAYTIGRKRPTTSWSRSLIWPNEQTWTASSKAGKQFSSVSTTSASLARACSALRAFFVLNFLSRSTCSCCLDRGVRASSNSGISSLAL